MESISRWKSVRVTTIKTIIETFLDLYYREKNTSIEVKMKLIKFRIKNYKSIKDSKLCYLDNKITIFAGKNEAGKTAILEALEEFNNSKPISEDAISLFDESLIPEIELTIKLNKKDLNKIFEKYRDNETSTIEEFEFKIIKIYPNEYKLEYSEFLDVIFPNNKKLENKIMKLIDELNENVVSLPVDKDYVDNQPYNTPNEKVFDKINLLEGLSEKKTRETNEKIETLKRSVEEFNHIKNFLRYVTDYFIGNFLPNFILFKTFDDFLPREISISQASTHELLKDLADISGLDFDLIQSRTESRKRDTHKKEINLKLQKDYEEFWTQDNSNIKVEWDSSNIYFYIEDRILFYPDVRSKGKQWHLAFYIRVTARNIKGENNVILIDEPGLFLHAKAQKDILNKLEGTAKNVQIMYTTHSPYLIPSDKLNRVRLVLKNDKDGTKIEKITANADKETLTPILTAIGEDLSVGIKVDKKNSIVVEGYSDYLYLTSFKNSLNIQNEMNFIPSVGADNVNNIGSILFGWRLNPIFILDNDKKGRQISKKLKEKLFIEKERIILLPENKEGSIEDLFSENDAKKYIEPNIQAHSKVLAAIQFYQDFENKKILTSDLTSDTIKNFENIFNNINNLTKIDKTTEKSESNN